MRKPGRLTPLGRYRHSGGNEYEVIAIARHRDTEEAMVIYRFSKYGNCFAYCVLSGALALNGRIFLRMPKLVNAHIIDWILSS